MRIAKKWKLRLSWLVAMFLAASFATVAQEESSSKPSSPDQQDKPSPAIQTANTQTGSDTVQVVPTPAYPVDSRIRAAGKAVPWVGSVAPLHWGPISIDGLDYVAIYDQFFPSGGGSSDIARLNMLRANITFAKVFRKSRFVFQYTPVLAILNGRLGGNADPTSDLSLGTVFTLSPRLTLTLKDDLGWHRTRQLFPDDLLLIDKQTGGLVQSYLLEPNGTLLTNSLSAAVDYKLSPRLLLSAVSTYVYSDIENAKNLFILHDSFNTVTLTYALSQRSNIGFVESVEFLHPVIPVSTNGLFQTSGLFYSEQFSPSLRISGQLGVQSAKAPGFGGAAWGVAGSLNLLKTFGNSDVAIAYFRGATLTNYIDSRQAEHSDISYGYRISRQLAWTNGIGYFRTIGPAPRDVGKYGLSTMTYQLPMGFSLFGSYRRFFQKSSNPLLLSGDRNTFVMGIRWEPAPAAKH